MPQAIPLALAVGASAAGAAAAAGTAVTIAGITLSTSEKDHELYGHLWLQRFDGNAWIPFGKALSV